MANSPCPAREQQLKEAHPCYVQYIQHCQRLNLAAGTLANIRCNLWLFNEWLGSQSIGSPLDATTNDLEAFVQYLSSEYAPGKRQTISKGSLSRYVGLLIQFYGFLVQERMLLSSPATSLKHPRQAKRLPKDVLSPEEFKLWLRKLSSHTPQELRDAVAIRIFLFSGMRLNELCNLKIDELNLKEREIIIRQGKGMRDRIAFFDHSTQKWLAQYLVSARPQLALASTNSLVVNDQGKSITPTQVQKMISRYQAKTRIRKYITPHSFRRSLCTLLLQAGINIKVISEIVGHHKLSTTAGYTKIDIETLTRIYQQGHPFA